MIPKETVDKIYDSLRVEEVISDFVVLKRAGANLKGLSPFSQEKTPSFMVSPSKQIWKDFSSGKGGNAIAFLMEHEHFSYVEALRYLAKKYNIEIVETQWSDKDKEKANELEQLYAVSQFAQDFFKTQIRETDEGKTIGLSYFRERGFNDASMEKFALGYSPKAWDALTKAATEAGFSKESLEKTGLSIFSENGAFDRFRQRVIFPIHSLSGRVLGFGARTLSGDKKTAKYLNSPESDIYHKGKILYGIFQAKQEISKKNNCFLVEGYTDVIQFNQRGIENVVASSGTALTPDQIRLIHRLTDNITLIYDGDWAGINASVRGVDLILEQGMNVRVCSLPQEEDPDSFAKKTPYQDLVEYLEKNTKDFISFKASVLNQNTQNDPIGRAQTIGEIVDSIAKIPDRIKQMVYVEQCARIMKMEEAVLTEALYQRQNTYISKTQARKNTQQSKFSISKKETENTPYIEVVEKELINHLVLFGAWELSFTDVEISVDEQGNVVEKKVAQKMKLFEKLFLELQTDEIELTTQPFREIYNYIIENFKQDNNFDLSTQINKIPQQMIGEISSIYARYENPNNKLDNWEKKDIHITPMEDKEEMAYTIDKIIRQLRLDLISKKIKKLSQEIEKEQKQEEVQQRLEEIKDYINLQKILSSRK